MKEITQTVIDGVYGNCYAACVASIFEIDLDLLPVLPRDNQKIEENHAKTCWKCKEGNACNSDLADRINGYWWNMWDRWFLENNLYRYRIDVSAISSYHRSRFDFWHICSGTSPRDPEQKENRGQGRKHAVVGRKGIIRWDPHPSRTGLLAIDDYEFITPADISKPILQGYLAAKALKDNS